MTDFAALTSKIYDYLTNNNDKKKKMKGKKFVIKEKLKFEDCLKEDCFKHCLEAT